MTVRTRGMARVATVLLALCLLAFEAPTASGMTRPSSPAPIKLGGIFDTYGPPSAVSIPILNGYKLAFTQANDTGGVDGAKIAYSVQNDNYDPSQTVPAAKTLVESDHVLAIAGIFGSDDSNAAIPYLNGRHVPFFDPIGGGAKVAGNKWIWQSEPSYALEGKIMAKYMTKTLHVHKLAALYQVGVNEPEVAVLKKTFGSKFLQVPYHATDTDLSTQLSEIRSFSPDQVALLGTLIPTADFVKLAAADGYKPPKGYFANYPQGDPTWLGLTSACSCTNGSHVSSYADLTGKNPVARAYAAAIKKYDPKQANTNYGLYGYFNGTLIIRALKLAGKHPTATRLQGVFNTKFRDYKSGFTGTLNWTPSYRYGVKQFKVYKISGSKFIPVTGWLNG